MAGDRIFNMAEGAIYIENQTINVENGASLNFNGAEIRKQMDKKETTSDVPSAIQAIMDWTDEKGDHVFKYGSQWQGIYRIFVDYLGWTSEYRGFANKVNELGKWRIPCSESAIQPIGNGHFKKPFSEWDENKSGMQSAIFHRTNKIAARMKELLKIEG